MDSGKIGACAGSVWNFLNTKGKTSVIRLKFELRCSATVLYLALGWLLKEEKINFSVEKGQLNVSLK